MFRTSDHCAAILSMARDGNDETESPNPEPGSSFDEWAIRLSQALDLAAARLDLQDQWQMGLLKFSLIQEFRFWRMVGDHHRRTVGDNLTDEKRDQVAATKAFDELLNVMPPEIQETLRPGRDGIIEMLMDAAGHQPRLN